MADSRRKKQVDEKVLSVIMSHPEGIKISDISKEVPFSVEDIKNSVVRLVPKLYEEDDGRLVYTDSSFIGEVDLAALYNAYRENKFEKEHIVQISELM